MQLRLNKSYSRIELMNRLFVFSVFMFALEYSLFLVASSLIDVLIKTSSLALLMVFALKPSNRINIEELILLLFYFMLFSSAALPSILTVDTTGGLILIKYLYMFMILPILLVCYRSIQKCDDLLISTFIAIGVLFSVQAIVALKEIVNFPIISDPSHASFWAPWVPALSYASIAAGADGLIIETHPNPEKSAVDPLQPLNFNQFSNLIKKSKKLVKLFDKKII